MLAILVTVAIASSKANWQTVGRCDIKGYPFRKARSFSWAPWANVSSYLPRRYEEDVMRVACCNARLCYTGNPCAVAYTETGDAQLVQPGEVWMLMREYTCCRHDPLGSECWGTNVSSVECAYARDGRMCDESASCYK